MTEHQEAASRALPPHAQLIQMGIASWVSAVVYAAAKLGLADQLATEPKNADELAGPMRMHAPSLHRLMRTLASLGILTERDAQRFALTPLGRSAQDRRPRLGAVDADRVRRHVLARLGGDPVFARDGQHRF